MVSRKDGSAKTSEPTNLPATPDHLPDDIAVQINSPEDALAFLSEYGITQIDNSTDALGDGFAVVRGDESKAKLVGVPFLLIDWVFMDSENYSSELVQARGITMDKRNIKFRLVDFSTGIKDQLKAYTARTGRSMGLNVPGGLVRSDYDVDDPQRPGMTTKATTFYLSNS